MLHIYLSTTLFSLLLFFCFTGVVLNHIEWLDNTSDEGELITDLTLNDTQKQKPLQELLPYVQKFLFDNYHLQTIKKVEFDHELRQIIFDYSFPAGYALIIVDVADNTLSIEYSNGNWLNVWTDLHKGRHSGEVWSWVIDVSAILMALFAVTGMIILFQNRKKRRNGVIAFLFGSVSPLMLYWLFVPYLTSH